MKTKKFGKKLVLSKLTVCNLNVKDMLAVQAGVGTISDDEYTCHTLCPSCYSQCITNCLTDRTCPPD